MAGAITPLSRVVQLGGEDGLIYGLLGYAYSSTEHYVSAESAYRNALLLQRVHYGADSISALEVMQMATENGAKLLNFEKVGKIQKGWAADLALFNVGRMEYSGSLSDPLAAIIFSGYNHGTEYTNVNGDIVVEKGRLTGFDETDLMNRCNAISESMLKGNS